MRSRGRSTPLDNEPEYDAEVAWFLRAFYRLSASRPVAMGAMGAIPLSEIATYWREVSRVGPIDEFVDVVQAVDAQFLQSTAKATKRGKT